MPQICISICGPTRGPGDEGGQASHLGLASCMKRLIWMATLSFWQSQYPACTPMGSHDLVAKLVDSAQLKP